MPPPGAVPCGGSGVRGWWHGAGNRRGHRPAGPSEGQCGFVSPVPSAMGSRGRKTRGLRDDGMTRCRLALPLPPGTAPPQPPALPERDDAAGQPVPVPEALLHRVGAGLRLGTSVASECSGGGSSPSPRRWRLREGTRPSLCPSLRAAFSHDPRGQQCSGVGEASLGTLQGHRPCPLSPPGCTRLPGDSGWGAPGPPPACPQGPGFGFCVAFCPSMSPGSVPWLG